MKIRLVLAATVVASTMALGFAPSASATNCEQNAALFFDTFPLNPGALCNITEPEVNGDILFVIPPGSTSAQGDRFSANVGQAYAWHIIVYGQFYGGTTPPAPAASTTGGVRASTPDVPVPPTAVSGQIKLKFDLQEVIYNNLGSQV